MVEAPGTGETFETLGSKLEEARVLASDTDESDPEQSELNVERAIQMVDGVLASSDRFIKDGEQRASLKEHAADVRRMIGIAQEEMRSWKDDE